jgi:hypothetical protein
MAHLGDHPRHDRVVVVARHDGVGEAALVEAGGGDHVHAARARDPAQRLDVAAVVHRRHLDQRATAGRS